MFPGVYFELSRIIIGQILIEISLWILLNLVILFLLSLLILFLLVHFKSEFQILIWFSLLVHHGIELFLKDEIVHFGVILCIRQLKVSRVDGLDFEELSEKELNHFKKVNKVLLFLFVKKHVFSHLLEDFVDGLVLARLIGCALTANFEEFEHFLFFDDLVVWVEFHFV